MKMSLYDSGAKEPPRRRKVRERERGIQTLFQRFSGGNSIDEYLESFKHHTGLYRLLFFCYCCIIHLYKLLLSDKKKLS